MVWNKFIFFSLVVISAVSVAETSFYEEFYQEPDPDEEILFVRQDKKDNVDLPAEAERILKANCFNCHKSNGDKPEQFHVLNIKGMTDKKRNDDKKILVKGKPEDSLLFTTLNLADKDKRMPRNKDELSAADKKIIEDWIKEGARNFPPKKKD